MNLTDKHALLIGGPHDGTWIDYSSIKSYEFNFRHKGKTGPVIYNAARTGLEFKGERYTKTTINEAGFCFKVFMHHTIDDQSMIVHLLAGYKQYDYAAMAAEPELPKLNRSTQLLLEQNNETST